MGRLADKNILITGGNSGIGLAAAQEFDREGARVAICGLTGVSWWRYCLAFERQTSPVDAGSPVVTSSSRKGPSASISAFG